jgi:hypothetical protein
LSWPVLPSFGCGGNGFGDPLSSVFSHPP